MKQAMKRFGKGFEKVETVRFGSQTVFSTSPAEKEQYFWQKGEFMVYLVPNDLKKSEIEKTVKTVNNRLGLYLIRRR